MRKVAFAALLLAGACGTGGVTEPPRGPSPIDGGSDTGGAPTDGGSADAGVDAIDAPDVVTLPGNLRIVAANISSGPSLVYGPPEGVRIFQGLKPDIALVQELNVGGGSTAEADAFVASTFGPTFSYYREPGVEIPNGIVSRFPILDAGSWADPQVANRGFAYAKIAVPGPKPLWAISLHLLTSSAGARSAEATALVAQVKATIPAADYLVIGGDFNTGGRNETCLVTLAEVVDTKAPYPADGNGNDNTNAPRTKAFDWLLADPDLAPREVPTRIGQASFVRGLVFDSRVFVPLADVAPVQVDDSAAQNMQHMPVVRDFRIPE